MNEDLREEILSLCDEIILDAEGVHQMEGDPLTYCWTNSTYAGDAQSPWLAVEASVDFPLGVFNHGQVLSAKIASEMDGTRYSVAVSIDDELVGEDGYVSDEWASEVLGDFVRHYKHLPRPLDIVEFPIVTKPPISETVGKPSADERVRYMQEGGFFDGYTLGEDSDNLVGGFV